MREAKQAAETQIALAQIEVDAKARASDEIRTVQAQATQQQRDDFVFVTQQVGRRGARCCRLEAGLGTLASLLYEVVGAPVSSLEAASPCAERHPPAAPHPSPRPAPAQPTQLLAERTRTSQLEEQLQEARQAAQAAQHAAEQAQLAVAAATGAGAEAGSLSREAMEALAAEQASLRRWGGGGKERC